MEVQRTDARLQRQYEHTTAPSDVAVGVPLPCSVEDFIVHTSRPSSPLLTRASQWASRESSALLAPGVETKAYGTLDEKSLIVAERDIEKACANTSMAELRWLRAGLVAIPYATIGAVYGISLVVPSPYGFLGAAAAAGVACAVGLWMSPDMNYVRGHERLRQRDYVGAESAFRRAVVKHASAYQVLGETLRCQAKWSEAEAAYQVAIIKSRHPHEARQGLEATRRFDSRPLEVNDETARW